MTPDQLNVSQVPHRERRFLGFLVGVGITAAIVIVLARYIGLRCWVQTRGAREGDKRSPNCPCSVAARCGHGRYALFHVA
jgi:hypothetical protein